MKEIVPSDIDKYAISRFSNLMNSFKESMKILKDHRIDEITGDIARIYGVISGNQYLQSGLYTRDTEIASKFKPELKVFVRSRLIFLINSVIDAIISNNIVGLQTGMPNSNVSEIRSYSNMRDLQLLEFDIIRQCNFVKSYNPHDTEDQRLDTGILADLPAILNSLIRSFQGVAGMVRGKYPKTTSLTTTARLADDKGSMSQIALFGYLIAKVTINLLISQTHYDADYSKDKNESEQLLVLNDYNRISSYGSLTIPGILCCYKNEMLLSIAVTDRKSELGSTEKTLLLNNLVLSKLTDSTD